MRGNYAVFLSVSSVLLGFKLIFLATEAQRTQSQEVKNGFLTDIFTHLERASLSICTLNRFNGLQLGDSGLRVKQLQQQLKDIGLYTDAIDGHFSESVKNPIVSLQTSKGLQADGIVGIKTWLALLWI